MRTKTKVALVCYGAIGVMGISSSVFAENIDTFTDDVAISIPVACTLSGTGMNTHNATLPNGIYSGNYNENGNNYTSGIGSTTLKAVCNDGEGFAIYAVGYTNEVIGNNNLVGVGQGASIVTGTATGPVGNTDTSNWAMKLAAVSGNYTPIIVGSTSDTEKDANTPDFSNFAAVPAEYTRVSYRNSATDSGANAEGATVTATYAAYISKTQAADTYSGKVKYTLVHPSSEVPLQPQTATSGCINYFPNGSNVVGTMGCQSIGTSATSATLLASNFSRQGYGFAGWSNKYDYATNPNQEGIKFYGPQEDITFTAGQYTGSNPGLSLYAVWVKSAGSLQDSTKVSQLCGTGSGSLTTAPTDGTANLSSVSALTDARDNQTYAIAKLADGKCWMIENLRLESTNSDNSTGALAQGYGTSTTYGDFSGLATAESANFNSTTANSLYYSGTQSGTATINIGTSDYPAYRMPRYNNLNTQSRASNPTRNTFSNSNTIGGMYSYGNYYTWHAAIADLTHNGTNNSSVTNTSLCPSGWRLPQGGDKTRITSNDDNDFWNLTVDALNGSINPTNYDSNDHPYYTGTAEAGPVAAKLRSYPNNFLYSGYFNTPLARGRGSSGIYWSSTASDGYSSYNLYLYDSNVYPGANSSYKSFGSSIRCTVSAGT